jgi:deferrochelatase/peroxidase EfeB
VPIRPAKQFILREGDPFTRNGSYMVLLQLEQRPAAFWAMCRELAGNVRTAFGEADEDLGAALLMGRTLDGSPLPPHPGLNPEDFSYYTDPFGRTCPAGAHIRLVNPRDVQTAGAMVLRRGIPYGAPLPTRDTDDGGERGLIFVCYQSDIEKQYEELQGRFANAGYDEGQPVSRFPDPIIGDDGHSGSVVEIPEPQGGSIGTRLNNTWVVPRGGLYLFVPSMAGLRMLCPTGAEAASV